MLRCAVLCADELERLEKAFDVVKKQLFGRLHAIARKSLLPEPTVGGAAAAPASNGGTVSSRSSSSSDDSSAKSSASISSTYSSVASLPSLAAAAAAVTLANGKVQNGTEKSAPPAAKASENGVAAAEPSQ